MRQYILITILLTGLISFGQSPMRMLAKHQGSVPPDADATAFLSATSITDPTISSAINSMAVNSKAHSFWTGFLHYPFVGGTSATHAKNFSLNATYYITWNGSWTHDANGVRGGGAGTDYGSLGAITTILPSKDNTSVTYYCNINSADGGVECGLEESGTHILRTAMHFAGNNDYSACNNGFSSSSSGITDSRVCYTISRTSSTEFKVYVNGSLAATTTSTSDALGTVNFYIGAQNNNGSVQYPSTKRCAYLIIGPGVDATKAANIYSDLQAFETALSRNN